MDRRPTSRPTFEAAKAVVSARDRGRCQARLEGCTGRGEHVHHVKPRGRGGSDDPRNLLTVCFRCHRHIHRHPLVSNALGLLLHSWQAEPPHPGGRVAP